MSTSPIQATPTSSQATNGANGSHSNGNGTQSNGNGIHTNGYASTIANAFNGFPSRNGSGSPSSTVDKENLEALSELHIEPGVNEVLPKLLKGTLFDGDTEEMVSTNMFGLTHDLNLTVYRYRFDIKKFNAEGKEIRDITKIRRRRVNDHFIRHLRKFYNVFMARFMEKYDTVFLNDFDSSLIDYGNLLLSSVELKNLDQSFELTSDEVPDICHKGDSFRINLVEEKSDSPFTSKDFSRMIEERVPYDSNIVCFFELSTSHNVANRPEEFCMYDNSKIYFMDPTAHGFGAFDAIEIGRGKYLGAGASKTVVTVEGYDFEKQYNEEHTGEEKYCQVPAIVIESKRTPFLKVQFLLETIHENFDIPKRDEFLWDSYNPVDRFLRNLACTRSYPGPTSAIILSGLSHSNALTERIPDDVSTYANVTINEYYQRKFQIVLQFPKWPLAYKKISKDRCIFFPIEVLVIADEQRVGNAGTHPDDVSKIITAAAVSPAMKKDEIGRCFNAFNFSNDAFCQNVGIKVKEKPLEVKARVLGTPKIRYASEDITFLENGTWDLPKDVKFSKTSSCHRWCAALIDHPRLHALTMNHFEDFCNRFIETAKTYGTNFDAATAYSITDTIEDIESLFVEAVKQDYQFILFGHDDNELTFHDKIKTLECKYSIVTQCVKSSTILNVINGSPATLENIILKANVKLGGLNHVVTLPNYDVIMDDFLFIGIGRNMPGGGLLNQNIDPNKVSYAVLGYAANDIKTPGAFVGNFFLQPPYYDEKLTVLDKIMEESLERFLKNRGKYPTRVIVYRSGASEGDYECIHRYEIPIISKIVKTYTPGSPITVIVVSKLHNTRFFPKNINPSLISEKQNIRAGTVIDSAVVHSRYNEFYLNAHVALQGTAKTPKFTILYSSEKGATLDMFERWTHALCFNFQIVTSPTSLPAPLLIAIRYAERGRKIVNNAELMVDQRFFTPLSIAADDATTKKTEIRERSAKINYSFRPKLRERRINA